MITFIRSHSGSSRSYFAYMAAGRASVSASREQVASRRPTRAPFFNEKEYFYRQRVLRRARKMTASFDRSGIPAGMVSLDTAAALAVRCSQLEWSAAVAHYNASFLHERLCRVEAAAGVPPLPFPVASPEVQPEESTAGFRHDSAMRLPYQVKRIQLMQLRKGARSNQLCGQLSRLQSSRLRRMLRRALGWIPVRRSPKSPR